MNDIKKRENPLATSDIEQENMKFARDSGN